MPCSRRMPLRGARRYRTVDFGSREKACKPVFKIRLFELITFDVSQRRCPYNGLRPNAEARAARRASCAPPSPPSNQPSTMFLALRTATRRSPGCLRKRQRVASTLLSGAARTTPSSASSRCLARSPFTRTFTTPATSSAAAPVRRGWAPLTMALGTTAAVGGGVAVLSFTGYGGAVMEMVPESYFRALMDLLPGGRQGDGLLGVLEEDIDEGALAIRELEEIHGKGMDKCKTEHPYSKRSWLWQFLFKCYRYGYLMAIFAPAAIGLSLAHISGSGRLQSFAVCLLTRSIERAGCTFQKFAQWLRYGNRGAPWHTVAHTVC